MEYEVPPTGLGSTRWYARIAAALAVGALIVGVGFLARTPTSTEEAAPSPSTGPSITALTSLAPRPRDADAVESRAIPEDLACHGLTADACSRAANAALRVLTPDVPPVASASVFDTLLCSSNFDCPQGRLTNDTLPLGSVTLTFVDGGPEAWINVIDRFGPAAPALPIAEAWLVRWH